MGQLDGKIAIVTGASRGMGASHARRFIAEGAQVLLTDMRADVGDALAAELGNRAAFAEHDVTNAGDWKRIVAIAEDRFGLVRSEEHTSELQSLMRISYAVFLLTKKNIISESTLAIIIPFLDT